jgi:hypothetical protein
MNAEFRWILGETEAEHQIGEAFLPHGLLPFLLLSS